MTASSLASRIRARWRRLPLAAQIVSIAVLGSSGWITLSREGALGKSLELDLSYFSTSNATSASWHSGGSSTSSNATPVTFAGRWVECYVSCSGDEALCEGFKAEFGCQGDGDPAPAGARIVTLSGSFAFQGEPSCLMPLKKSGTVPFSLSLSAGASHPGASKASSFMGSGTVTQDMSGIASCLRFKREMGRAAGQVAAQNVNQFLQAN